MSKELFILGVGYFIGSCVTLGVIYCLMRMKGEIQ